MDYTITLTETENKAMSAYAKDIDEWITNAAQNRARIAIEEIVSKVVAHCNENEIALAVGQAAQVQQAFDLGLVVVLADVPDTPADPL
jgi:ribosomal protein L18E